LAIGYWLLAIGYVPMILRVRHFEFHFPRPTLIMGIVNVTPDSFSDGGQFFQADAAVAHGLKLVGGACGGLVVQRRRSPSPPQPVHD